MTAIKSYLLRLIFCGFLIALSGALLRERRGARALALCGGCLMILTALGPLLQVDLSRLPDLVTGLTRSQRQESARLDNETILQRLVEEQTAAWIAERARELGLELACAVTAERGAGGAFVPYRAELRGLWTRTQREALSALLLRELEIPPERQSWVGG